MRQRSQSARSPGKKAILLGLGMTALALLVLIVGCQSGQSTAATDAGGPGRLVATTSTVDLGRVPFDRMVEAQYELANTGGRPVRIVDTPAVKTLQGC